jgi:GntR family transcriptional repressor for pyruvate dehydrogenase complex
MADMVADELRNRIISGEIDEGATLPRQEDLVLEFGISLPSLREALRILETEGLVSVRRGNAGAIVHRPSSDAAASMLGAVLRWHNVVLEDLAATLRLIEPLAAGICADQPDRAQITERLRALNDQAAESLSDGTAFTVAARAFHDEISRSCGLVTLRYVLGTVERLWTDYEEAWAHEHSQVGTYPTIDECKLVLAAHEGVANAIKKGNRSAAETVMRHHLEDTQKVLLGDAGDTPLAMYPAIRGAGNHFPTRRQNLSGSL